MTLARCAARVEWERACVSAKSPKFRTSRGWVAAHGLATERHEKGDGVLPIVCPAERSAMADQCHRRLLLEHEWDVYKNPTMLRQLHPHPHSNAQRKTHITRPTPMATFQSPPAYYPPKFPAMNQLPKRPSTQSAAAARLPHFNPTQPLSPDQAKYVKSVSGVPSFLLRSSLSDSCHLTFTV